MSKCTKLMAITAMTTAIASPILNKDVSQNENDIINHQQVPLRDNNNFGFKTDFVGKEEFVARRLLSNKDDKSDKQFSCTRMIGDAINAVQKMIYGKDTGEELKVNGQCYGIGCVGGTYHGVVPSPVTPPTKPNTPAPTTQPECCMYKDPNRGFVAGFYCQENGQRKFRRILPAGWTAPSDC